VFTSAPGIGNPGSIPLMSMESGLVSDALDTLNDPRRVVSLQAAHNFRDLGGYPAADGRVTRWRQMYRADGPQRLTDDDIQTVTALGLRTVIDLRSNTELEERGVFPHHRIDVNFVHHPVIDTTWEHDSHVDKTEHEFLTWAYRSMLQTGSAHFARAIETLAVPGALPAVFHCAAGKDRTGVLAVLVLGALGVPRSIVLGDYALTAAGTQRMREWAEREMPDLALRLADAPSAFLASLPEAMGEVYDDLVDAHGSIRHYVLSIGVSEHTLATLGAAFLTESDAG
jgi:protein-tyrosine phosphatase